MGPAPLSHSAHVADYYRHHAFANRESPAEYFRLHRHRRTHLILSGAPIRFVEKQIRMPREPSRPVENP
jgi:hypothetical protein